MIVQDLVVIVGAIVLSGALGWFFFGPRRARAAELVSDVQQVTVTLRGGYSPDLVRVRQGVPLRIVFDRQESGECSSRVVLSDFAVNRPLPAFAQTTVQLVPDRAGEFEFACGMNMVHGTLVVEPTGGRETAPVHLPREPSAESAAPEEGLGGEDHESR